MSADADRLRQAADRLDERVRIVGMKPWLVGSFAVSEWVAQAALLRAVAKHQRHDKDATFCGYCAEVACDDDCPWTAALSLADVILGVSE